MTAQEIHDEIVTYLVSRFGSDFIRSWYIGIANNPEQRLFSDHNVDRNSATWIYRRALDVSHARMAEVMLLNRGHDGGSGGGDHMTTYVYAFRKDPGTVR